MLAKFASAFPRELEIEFAQHYRRDQAPLGWLGMLIGSCLYILFYVWDIVIDFDNSTKTLIIRLLVSILFVSFLLLPSAIFERYMQLLLSIAISAAGIGVVVIISILDGALNSGLSGVVLVLMFNFGFFRLLFIPSVLSGVIICVAYNVSVFYYGIPVRFIVANNFFLISATISSGSVTYLLERLFRTEFLRNKEIALQKSRADHLLFNLLPERIAERLKSGDRIIAESHGEATVFFSDVVDFSQLTKRLSPGHLVEVLNDIFSILDSLTEKHGVEKIKTIGDGYMVVSGMDHDSAHSAEAIAEFALEVMTEIQSYSRKHDFPLLLRIGISTGQVISGVIGTKKLSYDLWGETVNLASRMETHAEVGRIHVTETTYWRLREKFEFEERGLVEVKGLGKVKTYFLIGRKSVPTEMAS